MNKFCVVGCVCFTTSFCFIVIGCNKIEQDRSNGHDTVNAAKNFVRQYPSNPDAYAALGDAWYDQGEYNLAIANHKKSLRLAPQRADVHAELGDDYMLAGQKDKAHAEWERAIHLDNHVPPTETHLHAEEMLEKYP